MLFDQECIQIPDTFISKIEDGVVWSVIKTSESSPQSYFVVKKEAQCYGYQRKTSLQSEQYSDEDRTTNGPCLSFKMAKACRHTFSCGCSDYLNGNHCRHILKIATYSGHWHPGQACVFMHDLENISSSQHLLALVGVDAPVIPGDDDEPYQESPPKDGSVSYIKMFRTFRYSHDVAAYSSRRFPL